MAEINWIAVVVAALSTFVVGGAWYSPAMFLKPWQKAMNISDDQAGHPAKVFGLAFVFSVVACAFLSTLIGPQADWLDGLRTGALVGFCFIAMSFGVNYQFANRSFTGWFIDGGYNVVTFAVSGLILGAWP